MRNAIQTTLVLVLLAIGFTLAANDWKAPWTGPPVHGDDWCVAHDVLLEDCPICNVEIARGGTFLQPMRDPRPGECPNTVVQVRLAEGAAEDAGLAVQAVERRRVDERVVANAEVEYAPGGLTRVAPRVGGVVQSVHVRPGQAVEVGALLVTIESTALAGAFADYARAHALLQVRRERHERLAPLAAEGIVAGEVLLAAEGDLAEARVEKTRTRDALRILGIPDEAIARSSSGDAGIARLEVRAPAAGVVAELTAVVGEVASPERALCAVADLSRPWVAMAVHEADLPRVAEGQAVRFTVAGSPQVFKGTVVALGTAVDDIARTTPVYAEVENSPPLLRVHQFGRAAIVIRPPRPTLLVPKAAVQNDGDCNLVFVQPIPGVYQARAVKLGQVFDGGYEVLSGLAPGQAVVTTGAFLLKTELLRGQMGAG